VQLHRARSDFEAAGVPLVLIGQATPRHATHFRRRHQVDLPVLADEKRESYSAAGAKVATAGELLGPKTVGRGLMKTVGSGGKIRQGKVVGHPAQLGGAMIVKPDGTIPWSHLSEDASDNAPADEILAAARQASTTG
jgi:peroxiredoxin